MSRSRISGTSWWFNPQQYLLRGIDEVYDKGSDAESKYEHHLRRKKREDFIEQNEQLPHSKYRFTAENQAVTFNLQRVTGTPAWCSWPKRLKKWFIIMFKMRGGVDGVWNLRHTYVLNNA